MVKTRLTPADQLIALFAAALPCAAFVLALAARSGLNLLPPTSVCWSVALLGRKCPGCGLTRSFVALAGGHLTRSLALNPIGPVLFFALVSLLAVQAGKLLLPGDALWHRADWAIAVVILIALAGRTVFFYGV